MTKAPQQWNGLRTFGDLLPEETDGQIRDSPFLEQRPLRAWNSPPASRNAICNRSGRDHQINWNQEAGTETWLSRGRRIAEAWCSFLLGFNVRSVASSDDDAGTQFANWIEALVGPVQAPREEEEEAEIGFSVAAVDCPEALWENAEALKSQKIPRNVRIFHICPENIIHLQLSWTLPN